MKMRLHVIPFLMVGLITFSVLTERAFSSEQNGKVIDLRISSRTNGVNPTHIRLNGDTSGLPPCASSTNYWALDTDTPMGKNILALILYAMAMDKAIAFWSQGTCGLRSDMVDLHQAEFSN